MYESDGARMTNSSVNPPSILDFILNYVNHHFAQKITDVWVVHGEDNLIC